MAAGTSLRNPGKVLAFASLIPKGTPEGALVELASTDNTVQLPAGAAPTTPLFGLLYSKANPDVDNAQVEVVTSGIFPGIAGDASITGPGLMLTAEGTDGKLKVASASAGTNVAIIGVSMEAAAAEDERVAVLLTPGFLKQF